MWDGGVCVYGTSRVLNNFPDLMFKSHLHQKPINILKLMIKSNYYKVDAISFKSSFPLINTKKKMT